MGLYSKEICAICGEITSPFHRALVTTVNNKKYYACTDRGCYRKLAVEYGEKYHIEGDRIILDKPKEIKVKCNNCGYIYCYSESDIEKNKNLASAAQRETGWGVLGALGGTNIDSYMSTNRANNLLSEIKDFSKCPKCNSSDIITLSDNEYQQEKNKNSSVEELKQYKELLDNGVITQEEFEAKKKQLLGI